MKSIFAIAALCVAAIAGAQTQIVYDSATHENLSVYSVQFAGKPVNIFNFKLAEIHADAFGGLSINHGANTSGLLLGVTEGWTHTYVTEGILARIQPGERPHAAIFVGLTIKK